MSMPSKTLANAVAKVMQEADACALQLGIEVLEVSPGSARVCMRVRPEMLNGIQIAHGGMIFTLADATFAFACNSRNERTVAAACLIDFLIPAHLNDVLTATALEQSLAGRHGIYDVRIENQRGETVALFRGKSTRVSGQHVADAGAP